MSLPANGGDFSPYAQLVAALLPRAGGVSLFQPDGRLVWTSEEAIGDAAQKLIQSTVAVADRSAESGECSESTHGDPLYFFWLRNDAGQLMAVLSIRWRSETEARSFAYVHSMLRPMLECLRRELLLRARLTSAPPAAAATTSETNADLQVLLSAGDADQKDGAGDGLRELLQNVNRHMQCEFTALVMPDRHLVAVVKAEGRQVDTSLLPKIHRHLLSHSATRSEILLLNTPGSLTGVTLTHRVLACPLRQREGQPVGVLVLFRAIGSAEFTRRDSMLAELLARRATALVNSSYDTLTGLLTPRAFEQRARALLARRGSGRVAEWSALHVDLDGMHVVNDRHGMHVGDTLLTRVAELIRSRLAPGTLAARITGDRFSILLPSGEADAAGFAEALRTGVAMLSGDEVGVAEPGFSITISAGVAVVSQQDLTQALVAAETACKLARHRGRNRVEIHRAGEAATIPTDDNGEAAVQAMFAANRLRLDAQPMAPMPGTKSLVPRFELLLRVIDDSGAAAAPGKFIAAAARCNLLPQIDRWVVQQALTQLSPHGILLADTGVVFGINLAGPSLLAEGFVDFVVELIRNSPVPPQSFCFEINENVALANLEKAAAAMRRLTGIGCSVALDNFGTGMSSLEQLRSMPLSVLKIDGSFVREVLKEPRAATMVQTTTQLARNMNLTTVAQHVETEEIRRCVAQLGADYAQGFVVGRPDPLTEVIRDLSTPADDADASGANNAMTEDNAISAELEQELLEAGIAVSDQNDAVSHLQKVLAGYDHGESTVYQRRRPG